MLSNDSMMGSNEARIRRLEDQINDLQRMLAGNYIKGRLRTDRTAPVDSSDVVSGIDKIYDVVRDTNYEYILINDSGNLRWRRISYSSF